MNLFLMRHADAIKNDNIPDKDRILSDQGKLEARQTASFLQTYVIDKVIVSSILRALDTYKILAEYSELYQLKISDNLYTKDSLKVIKEIQRYGQESRNLLLIGHNPIMSELAQKLVNQDSQIESVNSVKIFPTASVVKIEFSNMFTWTDLTILSKGNIKEIFIPKMWD